MGHSDIFDINVPGFFFKIWYQCPNSCPTFLTQILSLYDMKLRITITWIVEFFSYCVYFMWKQYWFHQIHTTKLGLGEAVWEKCFVSHLAQNFDIKCPSWWPQILISSHCSCPTLTVLSVLQHWITPSLWFIAERCWLPGTRWRGRERRMQARVLHQTNYSS